MIHEFKQGGGLNMCGLVGFYKLENDAEVSLNRIGLIWRSMQTRGRDATGYTTAFGNDCLFTPQKFQCGVDDVLEHIKEDAIDTLLMVGHTRYATHGDVENDMNNHPHEYENDSVYGVVTHNGVIGDHKSIALLEEVATVALEEPGNYELENTMLRRILLVYGTHELTCPKHPTFTLPLLNAEEGQVENNLELICDCSWEYIKMKLLQDTITTLQEDGSKKEIP